MPMSVDKPFLLRPGDRGLYLRIEAPSVEGLSVFTTYYDVRDIEYEATSVLGTSAVTALAGAPDVVRMIARGGEEQEHSFVALQNLDSSPHIFVVSVFDGTNTAKLAEVEVLAGQIGEVLGSALPSLLEGWSYRVALLESVVTTAPRVVFGYTDTNIAPVAQNEGGAF